jgi:hypothetical protein
MNHLFRTFLLVAFFVGFSSNTLEDDQGFSIQGKTALDARLNTYKEECKNLIKPARYDGARMTYYVLQKKPQKKIVEVFMLLSSEYKFAFSTKECSTTLTIRFYDSKDESNRTLIKEIKNAKGKNLVQSSDELNELYRKKQPKSERLKNMYVEYEIGAGKDKYEAIVMVVGYN